ncbi:Glyoxalase/bleomycin resistance protein/dioxygenase [Candidatus Koribacter versatilis Ellin345]|uniref:Glyoxalase/bleomycin resistance protein/dioxygenase n=1 Tax=Koribacter versatilis (strain Ellin345) TaxID=204669 RepID=Q1IR05_KORVE|nr:VOC family protein [Candidatus Koribacter versatilis]ABF40695.1 Glyoxalase/bleomycin resistance protein/dioxygenase [Candidatus Koribacter versatilis Ellin345]
MRTFARQSRWLAPILALCGCAALSQPNQPEPKRPRITGFAHVAVYVTDLSKAQHFYGDILGYEKISPTLYRVNTTQSIELEQSSKDTDDRIAHIAFLTDSADGMLAYLRAKGIKVPDKANDGRNGARWFALTDPAGQAIEFLQEKPQPAPKTAKPPASKQIIHVGFIVRDRAAEEHFYQDILGFRLYWHGGMEPNRTDWVALQVPDGTVWIEEMRADEHPSKQDLGVLNHFSLGVEKMTTVIPNLKEHGWVPVGDDGTAPEIGKDGKWQFDIFDPDLTRVEYMEFRPTQKPCCSDFTGPHPHD